jgi:hypothetical protein
MSEENSTRADRVKTSPEVTAIVHLGEKIYGVVAPLAEDWCAGIPLEKVVCEGAALANPVVLVGRGFGQ